MANLSNPSSADSIKKVIEECKKDEKGTLIVEVKSYFLIRKEDGNLLPSRKVKHTKSIRSITPLGVLDASVTIVEKSITQKTSVGQKGKVYAPAKFEKIKLPKGTYTIKIDPHPDRLSKGPAGRSTKGKTTTKVNDYKARMYRAVSLFVEINDCFKVVAAWVPWIPNSDKKQTKKPPNAVPWEWNYANAWVEGESSNTVYVDLKPDWWSGYSNKTKNRARALKRAKIQNIDLIALHNTGACSDGDQQPVIKGKTYRKSIGAAIKQGMKKFAGHYYVDLDGHVVKLYDEDKLITFHTDGKWLGKSSNTRSIGIETCRPWQGFQEWDDTGHKTKPLDHLRQFQFDSMVHLLENLTSKIPRHRIIGHSDGGYAHGCTCPGCDYWWDLLEKKGLGMLLPEFLTLRTIKIPKDYPDEPEEFKEWFKDHRIVTRRAVKVVPIIISDLKDIGYQVNGKTLNHAAFAILRFQTHFYSGSRYHLRYSTLRDGDDLDGKYRFVQKGKNITQTIDRFDRLSAKDKTQKGLRDGRRGKYPTRPRVIKVNTTGYSPIEVDRRLALSIRYVAIMVAEADYYIKSMSDRHEELLKLRTRLSNIETGIGT